MTNVGSGGGAAAAAPAAGGGGGGGGETTTEAEPEKKKEEGELLSSATNISRKGNTLTRGIYREGGVRRGHGLRSVRLERCWKFANSIWCSARFCGVPSREMDEHSHSDSNLTIAWTMLSETGMFEYDRAKAKQV